jgi:nitroreductase
MTLIDSLQWRYATKRFDPKKKVSDADIATLKEAVRLTPSSYGFQLYKVIVVISLKSVIVHIYLCFAVTKR